MKRKKKRFTIPRGAKVARTIHHIHRIVPFVTRRPWRRSSVRSPPRHPLARRPVEVIRQPDHLVLERSGVTVSAGSALTRAARRECSRPSTATPRPLQTLQTRVVDHLRQRLRGVRSAPASVFSRFENTYVLPVDDTLETECGALTSRVREGFERLKE